MAASHPPTLAALLAGLLLFVQPAAGGDSANSERPKDIPASGSTGSVAPEGETCACETFDTSVEWSDDLERAARAARGESKLLFVMHLSGNFAKSAFT